MKGKNLQAKIFAWIEKRTPEGVDYKREVANILSLSMDSLYKMVKGETVLKLNYVLLLKDKYGFSLDMLYAEPGSVSSYTSSILHTCCIHSYIRALNDLCDKLAESIIPQQTNWLISSDNIPLFPLLKFSNLAFFNMYLRYRRRQPHTLSYEEYVASLPQEELKAVHQRLFSLFESVDTIEIFTGPGIFSFRDLILSVKDKAGFYDQQTPQRLLNEMKEMLDQMHRWSITGSKNGNGAHSMYYSDVRTNFEVLLSFCDDKSSYLLKREYDTNIFWSHDDEFVSNTADLFRSLKKQAVLVDGLADTVRDKLFNGLSTGLTLTHAKLL